MRPTRYLALLLSMPFLAGCRNKYLPPETPMPPNTILLSQMMRELSAQPGFTDALLKQLDNSGAQPQHGKKPGPALLTPKLLDELRNRILGKDWSGLDRFPGWTMSAINPTVRVVGHYAGKDQKLESASEVHPGTPLTAAQANQFLDLGPYALDKPGSASLNSPSTLPPFTTVGLVTPIGNNITRGDGPNDLAPEHAESQRLADILNRLAANKLSNAEPFTAAINLTTDRLSSPKEALYDPTMGGSVRGPVHINTPENLISTLQSTGHAVTVNDTRYFANFTHLHYKGQDVMAPFWIDTKLKVPHTASPFGQARPLLIPVSHAELEWHIHGPLVNADISYYFGIDGKAEWRTMDTLDQPWVLKRNAHTYTGAQAVEATRLAGLLTVAYMHAHAAHPRIPFGGYYALGVCQDGVSAVEQALTGHVTLFPNTVDATLFNDPRDAEINRLLLLLPKDRSGEAPSPARVFGSLPADPGPNNDFAAITIPGLAEDLAATYATWNANGRSDTLGRAHNWRFYAFLGLGLFLLLTTTIILGESRRRATLSQP
jgi:hypothetical protein